MAGAIVIYYRNYDSSDTTATPSGRYTSSDPLPTIEACGWEPPSGYQLKEWNMNRDGSGLSFQPGDTISGGSPGYDSSKYAIWEPIPVPYLVTSTELTSIADVIRTKGGTSAALEWPTGFASAIQNISGGSGNLVDVTGTFAAANVHLNPEILKAVVDSDIGIVFFYMEIILSNGDDLEIFAPSGYEPIAYFSAHLALYSDDLSVAELLTYEETEGYWASSVYGGDYNCIISGAYRITV